MKKVILIICLIFNFIGIYAKNEGNELKIKKTGKVINIIDFEEGAKIKLFELKTYDIVLVKTRGEIDFSQLPEGKYVLIDSSDKKIIIDYKDGVISFYEMA
ncbi:hypothetical protein [Aquimarina sp. 2201CG5-10]|uniref:hypothetical protein n=1 Tax=Aquimarina callyspongiae TaxID=3098150 RepID=UPI002AB52155|nr:hypothetical protein [Aquimarina sp. 2201CG5-10]MDY8134519.1 hypothetical protein [Aquimarina sp. 2201CG5-10]